MANGNGNHNTWKSIGAAAGAVAVIIGLWWGVEQRIEASELECKSLVAAEEARRRTADQQLEQRIVRELDSIQRKLDELLER